MFRTMFLIFFPHLSLHFSHIISQYFPHDSTGFPHIFLTPPQVIIPRWRKSSTPPGTTRATPPSSNLRRAHGAAGGGPETSQDLPWPRGGGMVVVGGWDGDIRGWGGDKVWWWGKNGLDKT